MTTLITAVNPQQLIDVLQQAGFRASEIKNGDAVLIQSAAQGLNFDIRFGATLADDKQAYTDFAFSCPLQIQGELNPQMIENWNRHRRFARLSQQGQWLVLVLDVLVIGGVSHEWLKAQCELWDGLLREYLRHLQTPVVPVATA